MINWTRGNAENNQNFFGKIDISQFLGFEINLIWMDELRLYKAIFWQIDRFERQLRQEQIYNCSIMAIGPVEAMERAGLVLSELLTQ